jgi:hypothetical protein
VPSGLHLYGFEAIEALRRVLRETHPEQLSVADSLIDWNIKKGPEPIFKSSKRQLRFRMPSSNRDGRGVSCLNLQVLDDG